MTMARLIEYDEASAEIRAVYDDIMATRGTNWINNFWKALANHPPTSVSYTHLTLPTN